MRDRAASTGNDSREQTTSCLGHTCSVCERVLLCAVLQHRRVTAEPLQFVTHRDYPSGYGSASIAVGDINGDTVAGSRCRELLRRHRRGAARQRGWELPAGEGDVPRAGQQSLDPRRSGISIGMASRIWPSPARGPIPSACSCGIGDGTFQQAIALGSGQQSRRLGRRRPQRRRQSRSRGRQRGVERCFRAARQRRWDFPGGAHLPRRQRSRLRDRRGLQSRRHQRSGGRQHRVRHRLGAAGQRRRQFPGAAAPSPRALPCGWLPSATSTEMQRRIWRRPTTARTPSRCCLATVTGRSSRSRASA